MSALLCTPIFLPQRRTPKGQKDPCKGEGGSFVVGLLGVQGLWVLGSGVSNRYVGPEDRYAGLNTDMQGLSIDA